MPTKTPLPSPSVRLARFLGRVGRVLITAGVLILSFVAYQLWGTGLHTDDLHKHLAAHVTASRVGDDR